MKTIRERALSHYPFHPDNEFEVEVISPMRRCYIEAATEQRDIDIQKACDSFCKAGCPDYHKYCSKKEEGCRMYLDFCKYLKRE